MLQLPWTKGKQFSWDVTVPDTYADSHLVATATTAGAAADKAASNKEVKYRQLANSHIFVPVAIDLFYKQHPAIILYTLVLFVVIFIIFFY